LKRRRRRRPAARGRGGDPSAPSSSAVEFEGGKSEPLTEFLLRRVVEGGDGKGGEFEPHIDSPLERVDQGSGRATENRADGIGPGTAPTFQVGADLGASSTGSTASPGGAAAAPGGFEGGKFEPLPEFLIHPVVEGGDGKGGKFEPLIDSPLDRVDQGRRRASESRVKGMRPDTAPSCQVGADLGGSSTGSTASPGGVAAAPGGFEGGKFEPLPEFFAHPVVEGGEGKGGKFEPPIYTPFDRVDQGGKRNAESRAKEIGPDTAPSCQVGADPGGSCTGSTASPGGAAAAPGGSASGPEVPSGGAAVDELQARFGLGRHLARKLQVAADGCPVSDHAATGRVRGVFPLPYLCRRRATPTEGPRRAGARRHGKTALRNVSRTNFVLATLNLLFGGVACMAAALTAPGGAAQRSAVATVHRAAAGWNFGEEGQGLAVVEQLTKLPIHDYAVGDVLSQAVDLDPDRIALPEVAGTAVLLDLLPEDWAARYADEAQIVQRGIHEEAAGLMRGKVFNSPSLRNPAAKEHFLRKLDACGMLRYVDSVGEYCGLFAVRKGPDRQRLIVDARVTNEQWVLPPRCVQASGPLIARQLQRLGLRAKVGKADLSNYYYALEMPEWMSRWFVVGYLDGRPVGLRVLPMGCSHAVALGSTAHCEVLRRTGFSEVEQLCEGQPLHDGLCYAVVIDDLIIMDGGDDENQIADLLRRALAAYEVSGLPISMKKVEWPTDGPIAALGAERSGGSVGASREKRERLTAAMLCVGEWQRVSPEIVESMLGHAIWGWLFRRCGLAVLSDVFAFVDEHRTSAGRGPQPFSRRHRWECITCGSLLCLARIDLGAHIMPEVLASDASLWGCGVVTAQAGEAAVREALRFCELRGEHVSLTGAAARRPGQEDRLAPAVPLPPEWEELVWTVKLARPWRSREVARAGESCQPLPPSSSGPRERGAWGREGGREENLNSNRSYTAPKPKVAMAQAVCELQSAALAAEWAARKIDTHGSMQLLLLDARSALGAWAKGRSSAFRFLQPLRRVAALSLATGTEWLVRWIPGEVHPGDEASRRFQPRRESSHDWKRGKRLGESDIPAPRDRQLRGRHVKPETIRVYMKAVLVFIAWASANAGEVRDYPALDFALCGWMEDEYEQDKRAQLGVYALSGIKLLSPTIYLQLPEARALLVDWQTADKVQHHPPLLFPLVLLLVQDQLGPRRAAAVGFALLLSFLGILRISETTSLRVCDVVRPGGRVWGLRCLLLCLRHTKTGDDQSSEVWASWVYKAFAVYVERRTVRVGADGKLFPSASTIRSGLKMSLAQFGLEQLGYTPHSLRAGGALSLLNAGISLEEVLRRGRWRRPESARPYLQQLTAVAVAVRTPAAALAAGELLALDPAAMLSASGF